jgi:predicted unusual protein kinase regulating ubiquinone biosynthesis (AarF/ABC1/UbiB family)
LVFWAWAVVATVEASFGRPIAEVFERFDEQCLAAASIAQVYPLAAHGSFFVCVRKLA